VGQRTNFGGTSTYITMLKWCLLDLRAKHNFFKGGSCP